MYRSNVPFEKRYHDMKKKKQKLSTLLFLFLYRKNLRDKVLNKVL